MDQIYPDGTCMISPWPWWTVIVSINAINLIICAILFACSRNTAKEGDPIYRKRMRIMGLIFTLVAAWCMFYCSYGLFYHLPLESWAGAIDQMKTGFPMLQTGPAALKNAFTIVNESKSYGDWGFGFLLWHSAYFTVCVWIALFLMQAPRLLPNRTNLFQV